MRYLKGAGVVFGALLITALSIDASDTWRGSSSTLLGQLIGSGGTARCPEGMVEVAAGVTFSCVDRYEASPAEDCPVVVINGPVDTAANLAQSSCMAVSAPGQTPWRFVARPDAERLCARAGKRLPSAAEWYDIALDTPAEKCRINETGAGATGQNEACISAAKVFDMVGNVWEWVADDVRDGQYRERPLPPSGYVAQADADGVATMTAADGAAAVYGSSYFWSEHEGSFGMIRGGFYGSRSDAGVYTIHAHTPPEFTGEAVGFRCVQ